MASVSLVTQKSRGARLELRYVTQTTQVPPDIDERLLGRVLGRHGFQYLSLEHRAVIVLRYLLDLPLEQVAEALDIPVGTVGSRLNRAMQSLRAALEADARLSMPLSISGVTER